MSVRVNAIIVATATVLALTAIRDAQASRYSFENIADTGAGSFLSGQLFGTPVIVEGSSDVAFSGQSIQRATGIFIGNGSGATLRNQDPASQPTQQVLEVSTSLSALAVNFSGGLYATSVAAINQGRTTFPNYLNRGVNGGIDNSGNVVYVSSGQNGGESIVGVAPNGNPVTIVTPYYLDIATYGLVGPKIADKGSQVFGPSMIFSENQLAPILGIVDAQTVDNPLTTQDNYKELALGASNFAEPIPNNSYLTDISGSGAAVMRTFVPDSFSSATGKIKVISAQDWIVPASPTSLLPTKTQFMQSNSSARQSPIAPAIAIAKNSTAIAFSAGSSIYEGYVDGPTPKAVVTIGDTIGGKQVTGLQLAEKNFVSDQGYVTFKAGFADGTSAIFEASPTLGTLPFRALKSSANCFSCIFTAPTSDEDGFGTDIATPLYISFKPHGPVAVTAPDGGLFTSLMLADFTTDDHGQTPKSFMLHNGIFSTKIFANEPVMLPFPSVFDEFGVQGFLLDDFVGFSDADVTLGLTFYASPQGLDILVQNVPEPSCLLLTTIASVGACLWRRRTAS